MTLSINPFFAAAGLLVFSNEFMTFAWLYMEEPLKLDYLWAGLCLVAAAWFIFRGETS